jgi:hypothetical protein
MTATNEMILGYKFSDKDIRANIFIKINSQVGLRDVRKVIHVLKKCRLEFRNMFTAITNIILAKEKKKIILSNGDVISFSFYNEDWIEPTTDKIYEIEKAIINANFSKEMRDELLSSLYSKNYFYLNRSSFKKLQNYVSVFSRCDKFSLNYYQFKVK